MQQAVVSRRRRCNRHTHRAEALGEVGGNEEVIVGGNKDAESHKNGAGVLLRDPLRLYRLSRDRHWGPNMRTCMEWLR